MTRERDDHTGEIDLDVTGLDEAIGGPAGRWRGKPAAVRGRSPVLRPWPRVSVAAVTAIITAVMVTALASRTGPDPAMGTSVPAVVPETWLLEDVQRDVDPWRYPTDSPASVQASRTVPPQIDGRYHQVASLQAYPAAQAGELVALAPGTYDIYLVCHERITLDRRHPTATAQVAIDGSERLGGLVITCDRQATPLDSNPFTVTDYTALSITAVLDGPPELWNGMDGSASAQVDVGVAVFVVQH